MIYKTTFMKLSELFKIEAGSKENYFPLFTLEWSVKGKQNNNL